MVGALRGGYLADEHPAKTEVSMRSSASHSALLTADEFERLPGQEGYLLELVRGVVVRERGPGPLHGRLQSRMAHLLESWMEQRKERGGVLVHAGFVLATGPDTVRLPDVAYVSAPRVPESGYGNRLWRLSPDLAVEVISPSNTWTEIQEKVTDYFAAGTPLVWVVDPPTRTVTVYRPEVRAERLDESGALDGEDVLPGFRVRLAEYFDV
jgi:Uma2 family endonuclease